IGIFLLLTFPLSSVQAVIVWEDDFSSDLNEWDLRGFSFDGNFQSSIADASIDSGFTIQEEILIGSVNTMIPSSLTGGNWSVAMHNSEIVFGNWSFDIFMEKLASNQVINLEIAFMFRDPVLNYDWIGQNNDEAIRTSDGYILYINNVFLQDPSTRSGEHLIFDLDKHQGNGLRRITLEKIRFDVDLTKFHNIKIVRTVDYLIQIYFDNSLIIEYQESESEALTSSDRFVFFSWGGRYEFDNVTVVDSNEVSPSVSTDGLLGLFTISVISIIRFLRSKRKIMN
ncbi:MAG: hypothetical protein ACW967_11495, partial [Candidatus Hodarchaeales archaeon]